MSYATITDFTNAYDSRILGDLVSDSNVRVIQLFGNPVLQAILDQAAGQIDTAAYQSQRYSNLDLTSLTGQDLAVLVRLNVDIGYGLLRQRRGERLQLYPQVLKAEQMLEDLRLGKRVFAVGGAEVAGNPANNFPSLAYFGQLNMMVDYATRRYFSNRRYQQNQ